MDIRDYEKILDAIPNTGIYVIREDNHEILYFNERIRRMAPNVEKGTACDRMWANSCSNCPLLHMGQRQEGKSIIRWTWRPGACSGRAASRPWSSR